MPFGNRFRQVLRHLVRFLRSPPFFVIRSKLFHVYIFDREAEQSVVGHDDDGLHKAEPTMVVGQIAQDARLDRHRRQHQARGQPSDRPPRGNDVWACRRKRLFLHLVAPGLLVPLALIGLRRPIDCDEWLVSTEHAVEKHGDQAQVALGKPAVHLVMVGRSCEGYGYMHFGIKLENICVGQHHPCQKRTPSGACVHPKRQCSQIQTGNECGHAVQLLDWVLVCSLQETSEGHKLAVEPPVKTGVARPSVGSYEGEAKK
mmetsp:Transcript_24952/g.74967  ORF Transcript_24952/g.74967 Transcript_24952/m.74967 type:complete len:258 (-) Transcript_24952:356-1129(-)